MKEIKKSTGEVVHFDPQKLCDSIVMAGAEKGLADRVCQIVASDLRPGQTTSTIFRKTLKHLVKESLDVAALYSLKRGVNSLGPTGYLFEQYIEAVLRLYDYKTRRNIYAKGKCVEHEVDVEATKGNNVYIIEAKYRNDPEIVTHINDVMYAHARVMDIQSNPINNKNGEKHFHTWLVTNTKFTKQCQKYAACSDVKLTGWNHPSKDSLQNLVAKAKAYPITVIPSLTKKAREQLTKHGLILAQDLLPYSADKLASEFGVSHKVAVRIINEVQEIVN